MRSNDAFMHKPDNLGPEFYLHTPDRLFIIADEKKARYAREIRDETYMNGYTRFANIPYLLEDHFNYDQLKGFKKSYIRSTLPQVTNTEAVLALNYPERKNPLGLSSVNALLLGAAIVSEQVKTVFLYHPVEMPEAELGFGDKKVIGLHGNIERIPVWVHQDNPSLSFRNGDIIGQSHPGEKIG